MVAKFNQNTLSFQHFCEPEEKYLVFLWKKKNRFCFAIVRKSTAKYLFVPIFFPKINLFFADFIHRISHFILISALSQKRKRTSSKLTAECKT